MGVPGNNEVAGTVDDSAILEVGVEVEPGAVVGPFCRLSAGCRVGADSRLGDHVIVGAGVRIGRGVTISPGVYLDDGLVVEDGVTIGPNAAFVADVADHSDQVAATVLRRGASVGANSTVLKGVTIGRNAAVGAGAVVTREVPPNARVVGNPARIVGYQSSTLTAPPLQFRGSTVDHEDFPLCVAGATLHRFPHILDLRGSLSFGEVGEQLPFLPRRYFLIYDVPSREVRGEHAHRTLHEFLICVHGECSVAVDDGTSRGEVTLDRPDIALHLPPMVWGTQYKYSRDAVLLVLASHEYDDGDYIRDYDEFRRVVSGG